MLDCGDRRCFIWMRFSNLWQSIWRHWTYTTPAAVIGALLTLGVAIREAPVVRTLVPVRTVAAGQALVRHGRIVKVSGTSLIETGARRQGAAVRALEVRFIASSPEEWQLAPADLVLEFEGGRSVRALPPVTGQPDTSLVFAPGIERSARVRFPLPGGNGEARPVALRLRRPRTRFILEEG